MASYGNFQSDNKKYGLNNRDNYNPAFNSTVKAKSESQEDSFNKSINNWVEFLSWARWNPDLLLDLIKPEKGGVNLHLDQRVFLRCIMRFVSLYGVFPRGYGKTYIEVLAGILCCILYPNITIALTAQTKSNASQLLKDKYEEITRHFPLLKNEVVKTNFSKDEASITFLNGSVYDILANAQTSKGQRRRRIAIEESALLNNDLFEDALEPIVEVGRSTVGNLGVVNPEELNQQINFFTTSGFRGSDEYMRSLTMLKNMKELKGEIVLGSDWHMACWYGRGSTKEQVLKRKKRTSPVAFAQNYESKWVGCTEDSLVDVNKLLACRNLEEPEFEYKEGCEYVIGVDVARSQKTSNNRSSASVIKIIRNTDGTVRELHLVNLFLISNALTFEAQAIEVKKIKKAYKAKCVVIDGNGLGSGLTDALLKSNLDPKTGETHEAWATKNTDHISEDDNAEEVVYVLMPQSAQSRIVTCFMDVVDGGKLRLLTKKKEEDFSLSDKDSIIKQASHMQTDVLIEEVTNLKVKHLNNGGLTIEKVLRRIDKDRYASVAYPIWWILENDNHANVDDTSMLDYMQAMIGGMGMAGVKKNKYFN